MRFAAQVLSAGVAALGFAVLPSVAAAQKTGKVNVLLIDDETGDPVQGATIKVKGRDSTYMTDRNGRALIEDIPAGRIDFQLRAIGFIPRDGSVNIQADQTLEHRFGLAFTGDKLPELVVTARREKLSGRYQDFHRRQAAGSGYFILWDEIAKRGYSRLGDALRNVRGVHVECPTTHSCQIQMARSGNCPPAAVFVDGREADYFGPNTPIGDVYGIEVYRGAGDIPAEFASTGGCGAVVVWTKNRPYK